ncbi:MAG: hypothetical protein MJZ38_04065 [archaeon]|nr:hypothetical protein [archaeon]
MRTRSPQRTRRIRNAAIIGGVAGLAIGYICYVMTHNLFFPVLFTVLAASIGAATMALQPTEYD